MVQRHPSTPAERAYCASVLMACAGVYGTVSGLAQQYRVSRQTLYTWAQRGRRALEAVFTPPPPPVVVTPLLERQILTLLVEGHASIRGIAACLATVGPQEVSVGTISAVLDTAGQRALAVLRREVPPGTRAVALDEIYGRDRRGAYLDMVDVHSGAVWAAAGPLPVDGETWTLVLWDAQERGLRWHTTASDGGTAMAQACATVAPQTPTQRDVWHVLHECSKVQGRLDRRAAELAAQTATVARQAARVAAGQRPRGRAPRTDVAAHSAQVRHAQQVAAALRYLCGELHGLLDVVVLGPTGLRDRAARQAELDALLALLAELAQTAPAGSQRDLSHLHTHLTKAVPALLTFAAPLDALHQELAAVLGTAGLTLVAWAWQRRAILGPTTEALLAGLPPAWHSAARRLRTAWDGAVRASSAVETWHSFLRPHLAVHRTLSPGLLALLVVYYNHHVAPRGVHEGTSPVQRSGLLDAPTDWLVALGYPPLQATAPAAARITAHPAARAA